MDDSLYNSSWHLHVLPRLQPALSDLIDPPTLDLRATQSFVDADLAAHAESLRESLRRKRPRYEDEEEQEKLGSLTSVSWSFLDTHRHIDHATRTAFATSNAGASDARSRGLVISLVYEKSTSLFILYTLAPVSGSRRPSAAEGAVLLSKSSASSHSAVVKYLRDTFALDAITPVRLLSDFIQTSLQDYLGAVHASLRAAQSPTVRRVKFHAVVGTLRPTITFAPPVAPNLKSLDITVPAALVEEHFDGAAAAEHASERRSLISALGGWILAKTGLNLNAPGHQADDEDKENHGSIASPTAGPASSDGTPALDKLVTSPMQIARISTAAYVIAVDGRLKFASKAVEAVDDLGQGQGNLIRSVNEMLLRAIVTEANRQTHDKV